MGAFPELEHPGEEIWQNTTESMRRLYTQIRKMPQLTEQAKVIDNVLLNRLQQLKGNAAKIVQQFHEQKKVLLKRFDPWIMPIAKEVLEGFVQDAVELQENLNNKLVSLEQTSADEWNNEAKEWEQLCSRWNDKKGLVDKILAVVTDRTKEWIDKDMQVIQDYQSQTLAHLPKESEDFKTIEERLKQATAEPIKQLMTLRDHSAVPASLQQASEWVAKLQEKRESTFDQLLMKIDHVTQEVVQPEERGDLEAEGELIFMERELEHISEDFSQMDSENESEKQFIAARIEGLLEHAEELNISSERMRRLKSRAAQLLDKLT